MIRKNIYRSGVQFASHFRALRSFQMFTDLLIQIKLHLASTPWISRLPGSLGIQVRQHLVNFMGLAGIVNATVYKIKQIFTGLRHGKFS